MFLRPTTHTPDYVDPLDLVSEEELDGSQGPDAVPLSHYTEKRPLSINTTCLNSNRISTRKITSTDVITAQNPTEEKNDPSDFSLLLEEKPVETRRSWKNMAKKFFAGGLTGTGTTALTLFAVTGSVTAWPVAVGACVCGSLCVCCGNNKEELTTPDVPMQQRMI